MPVFIIEKDGQPKTSDRRVIAYADPKAAWIHREITPIAHLAQEKVMTYVSVSQLRLINSLKDLQVYLSLLEEEMEKLNTEGTPPK